MLLLYLQKFRMAHEVYFDDYCTNVLISILICVYKVKNDEINQCIMNLKKHTEWN